MVEGFPAEVAQIRRRLDRALASHDPEVEVLAQDLETALEELRVTEEEVRTQHEELDRLLEQEGLPRGRDERLLAGLPVPVVVTDRYGGVRSVNPASAALFAIPVARLLGKPLFAYVVDSSRPAARACLSGVLRTRSPRSLPVGLLGRGRPAAVTAYVAPGPRTDEEVTWLLLPEGVRAQGSSPQRAHTLDSVLAVLASAVRAAEDPREVVQRIAEIVAEGLGSGIAVTVSVGPPQEAAIVASTSPEAQLVDRWQLEAGGGPSPLCFESQRLVVTTTLRTDPRWSPLGTEGEGSPFGGAVAVPLVPGDGSPAVLTAYLPSAVLPAPELVDDLELLGAAVTSVLQELGLRAHVEQLERDMRAVLASRAEIEQAKGIVMAAKRCTADEAFQHLVMLSNTNHLKLREVAHQLVTRTGD